MIEELGKTKEDIRRIRFDLDELQAARKVHAELEALQEAVRKDVEADVTMGIPRRRVRALQHAAGRRDPLEAFL